HGTQRIVELVRPKGGIRPRDLGHDAEPEVACTVGEALGLGNLVAGGGPLANLAERLASMERQVVPNLPRYVGRMVGKDLLGPIELLERCSDDMVLLRLDS